MPERTYHVSVDGDDDGSGTSDEPLRSISAAASATHPGHEIVVHEGTYRERVDPPRGGTSDEERIVYRAAEGESVEIKGSEIVEGWERVGDGVWTVALDGDVVEGYNPFDDLIRGDWFDDKGREHHTGAVYLDGAALSEAPSRDALRDGDEFARGWYAEVDGETTLWARFGEADPTDGVVEITARPAVFYPEEPGRDYITVRGFTLRHAATQWAPPTTEQIGLLGTHWSKGWVVEDNEVSDSRCTGITLGKYGPSVDETGATADRYNETIRDALDAGWERGSVGHHVVRNNVIHDCGQAGIVGSMGAAFSEVTGNHIYDVNVEGAFHGAEIAGIKFHGAIDATIAGNHVHHARRGIWLDWMTQGTRVTRNVLYGNDTDDLFVEVNHGPFVVDTNLLCSETALFDMSQGGAYVHNLFAGDVARRPEPNRETPYHLPRSTAVAGLSEIQGGDDRFFNNVFVGGSGLRAYDDAERPVETGGNVFLGGAVPAGQETDPVRADADPDYDLLGDGEPLSLRLTVDDAWATADTRLVTTHSLGSAAVSDAPFTAPDGRALRVDTDFFGAERDASAPTPGPFEGLDAGTHELDLWPR